MLDFFASAFGTGDEHATNGDGGGAPASNYDRVRTVLDAHNGRCPQQAFSEELGVSAATVSRILQDMEERGAIVRIRCGREKIVCYPGAVPGIVNPDADD